MGPSASAAGPVMCSACEDCRTACPSAVAAPAKPAACEVMPPPCPHSAPPTFSLTKFKIKHGKILIIKNCKL